MRATRPPSFDALNVAYEGATTWLGHLTLAQTSVAWLLGALILAVIVARQARANRSMPSLLPADERLLPYMEKLLGALEALATRAVPTSPLERFAARLPDAEPAQTAPTVRRPSLRRSR
jgi:hypothetical protein